LKMLEKYQFLSTDWLLFGKGSMYKEGKMQSLFDYDTANNGESNEVQSKIEFNKPEIEYKDVMKSNTIKDSAISSNKTASEVIKIIWFYEDNSFEEFVPRR
jgi:hypothetical protein